jgi:hypothetical protein
MTQLLKPKHWILFLIMFLPSAIAETADLTGFWYLVCSTWCGVVYIGWLLSIGIAVYNRKSTSRLAIILFKAAAIYSLIFLLLAFYDTSDTSEFFPTWLISLIVLDLIIMVYVMFFAAKNMVQFEIDHGLETVSVFITFCAIWFFPIGLFFVQPRINRIIGVDPAVG